VNTGKADHETSYDEYMSRGCLAVVAVWEPSGRSPTIRRCGTRAGQDVALAGRLDFVWGDPLPLGSGAPRVRYVLTDDGGATWLLNVDRNASTPPRSAGVQSAARLSYKARCCATRELEVESLALESETDRDDGTRFRATGSQPYVWIWSGFADDASTPEQAAWFETQGAGPHPSLDDFWREVSFDNINLLGSQVVGWYTIAPRPLVLRRGHRSDRPAPGAAFHSRTRRRRGARRPRGVLPGFRRHQPDFQR
jgi:hypothetical protein